MADGPDPPADAPSPLDLGRAAAARIGAGEWQLDAPPDEPIAEPAEELVPAVPAAAPASDGGGFRSSIPHSAFRIPQSAAEPPSPEQIVEAMLFVGGPPLAAKVACSAVRGLTPDGFQAAVDALNQRYRRQGRPYTVQPRDGGFALALLPAYRGLRERVFGGPREARLSQPALDVLAVVAYRQPVGKAEVDAVRGTDSGGVLRHLVRLGLVAVRHRAEADAPAVRYGTTPRFLQVFGLASLDELPRLGETLQV
jgi:segregation and condensation protein B